MFLHQEEPFVLLNTTTKALMLALDDLRVRKRAKKGDQVADLDKGDNIIGGISIYEGAIRLRLNDGSIETVHSNNCYLDNPGSTPDKITNKPILGMFRPWEEKAENMAYKEQRKAEAKAAKLTNKESEVTDEEPSNDNLFSAE